MKPKIDFRELNVELEETRKLEFLSLEYIGSSDKYDIRCLECGNLL